MAIKEAFFIEQHGKKFVLYAGLLEEAHGRGLECIETELVNVSWDDQGEPVNAVVKARVVMKDGGNFDGVGDATRKNTGKMIAPHLIRMAETRAKARALRDAINVGVTALEELGGEAPAGETAGETGATTDQDSSSSKSQESAGDAKITRSQEARIKWLCKELKYKAPDLSGFTKDMARDLIDKLEAEHNERKA